MKITEIWVSSKQTTSVPFEGKLENWKTAVREVWLNAKFIPLDDSKPNSSYVAVITGLNVGKWLKDGVKINGKLVDGWILDDGKA